MRVSPSSGLLDCTLSTQDDDRTMTLQSTALCHTVCCVHSSVRSERSGQMAVTDAAALVSVHECNCVVDVQRFYRFYVLHT